MSASTRSSIGGGLSQKRCDLRRIATQAHWRSAVGTAVSCCWPASFDAVASSAWTSRPAIHAARSKAAVKSLSNIELHVADARSFVAALAPESFGLAVMTEVSFFLPRFREVIDTACRALRRGGLFFASFRSQYCNLQKTRCVTATGVLSGSSSKCAKANGAEHPPGSPSRPRPRRARFSRRPASCPPRRARHRHLLQHRGRSRRCDCSAVADERERP
jgi:Methyltransferase domain